MNRGGWAWLGWIGVLMALDGLWIALDHSVPAWDQGDHLARALTYAQTLQSPDWGSPTWWQELWQLSPSYRAPLHYLLTVPVWAILGAGWVVLVPFLATQRTNYLLDYTLMVVVTGTWLALTGWRETMTPLTKKPGLGERKRKWFQDWQRGWLWALAVGVGLGLTILTRPTGILFLAVPLGWMALASLRRWRTVGQVLLILLITLGICGFWIQSNWLTILTSIDKARAWGDLYQTSGIPTWWFYLSHLPQWLGWPLTVVGLAGWLTGHWLPHRDPQRLRAEEARLGSLRSEPSRQDVPGGWLWWLAFCGGGFGLCAVSPSYDPRFLLPIFGGLLLTLVAGLQRVRRSWRWITLGLSLGVMVIQQFAGSHAPDVRGGWPHAQVVQTVIEAEPQLRSTVAVLPLTAGVNPFNVNFYGNLAQFRVYGRQPSLDAQDRRGESQAFDWYLTKTGSQGIVTGIEQGQLALWQTITRDPHLQTYRQWPLLDGSTLSLWRRRDPHVQARWQPDLPSGATDPTVPQLLRVEVPTTLAAGSPIPVRYVWQGSPATLQRGLVLVDWRGSDGLGWIHDHTIGWDHLHPQESEGSLQVEEWFSMTGQVQPGRYQLAIRWLTEETVTPLVVPTTTITLTSPSADTPGVVTDSPPEVALDTWSAFRRLAPPLRSGQLDAVFREVSRLNQHDPTQAYYQGLETSLRQRLTEQPQDLNHWYSLLLVQVLQQHAQDALITSEQITTRDPDNPYAWLYQAVIHLYRWQGRAAHVSLTQARALNPDLAELGTLELVAALQRLDLPWLWRLVRVNNG